jgi:electron transport complex protein RnfD
VSDILCVSPSPHNKAAVSTDVIMKDVIIAMLPAFAVSLIFFGRGALSVTLTSIAACMFFEYAVTKLMKRPSTIHDHSAVVTGFLLAFIVPASTPLYMVVIGAFVAIVIGKMSFGGIGSNPFNPALVGRVFLMISFPVDLTSWPLPKFLDFGAYDGQTGATVLAVIKEGLHKGDAMSDIVSRIPELSQLFLGQMGGSLGEVSALAIIVGGLYLLARKVITWHIPFTYLASVFVIQFALHGTNPEAFADPVIYMFTGGLMLGAFFMATDYSSSPMSTKGKLIFGFGCGLLTVLIRNFGAYPEGVAFAILIMNAFVPLIDRTCKPRVYGTKG